MWEWIITHKAIILLGFIGFVVFFDRLATLTDEKFTLFGIPIGKYDNEIAKYLMYIKQAIFPGK